MTLISPTLYFQPQLRSPIHFPKSSKFHVTRLTIPTSRRQILASSPRLLCMLPLSNYPADGDREISRMLELARPFLRGEFERIDLNLPKIMSLLRAAGAGECWHKHSSFLNHLVGVYRILKLWGAPEEVCLCGLFHSVYSNSYANLAIFPPSSESREIVRAHVGPAAEALIHLFCIVPRQPLIHDNLLFKYGDAELIEYLRSSEVSLNMLISGEEVKEDERWRMKLRSLCPAGGITVKHIRTGEDVFLSRRIVATFLLITVADFSDQFFGFQDVLFDNQNGRLELSGNNTLNCIWPGDGKPGLWMTSLSRMAGIYTLLKREEEICRQLVDEPELVTPPIFNGCTAVVEPGDQIEGMEPYWEAVCNAPKMGLQGVENLLIKSLERNPFVGEPHLLLAQIYLGKQKFEVAEEEAKKGLKLLLEWGTPWDKRMTWDAWIAWSRTLLTKAKAKTWPKTPWGVLDLGLVK